jgi:catechol 2,3-dioxygenase-like lactoylglutathione lyase family enzyme
MRVAFVSYPVSDIARSRAFYRDVCGFGEGELLSESFCEFDIDGFGFALDTEWEYFGSKPGSAFGLGIEVDDLGATRARLEAAGANVEGYDGPRCAAIFVMDPDGNRVAFHHLKDATLRNV